ncbi:heparinase II/III-family protein [Sphingomonas sp. PB2P19]|uniref:heparinase II/III family protein n=1 Tax=Sphingomonas rhamnosi TaxID=3096156 RepID=UPI002FC7CF5C
MLRARPVANAACDAFFTGVAGGPVPHERNRAWDDRLRLYGHHQVAQRSSSSPDFLANPMTGSRWRAAEQPWFHIPDFDPENGDVKMVWELSRFEWAPAFAQAARQGQAGMLDRLNDWLDRWEEQNLGYVGPNWKCGQEASLRVLHLALAAVILDPQPSVTVRLLDFIETHLRRVRPTLSYALGQDNNHGTSEAAALFVGGLWLASAGRTIGRRYAHVGRRWLEERAHRLFLPDGTFSQYSVNYHRLALDTFVIAELSRRRFEQPEFSKGLRDRLCAATDWLHTLVDPLTGDAPNLGHNDGARIAVLTDSLYRDYRPSVARGKALFCDQQAYDDPLVTADLAWLNIEPGKRPAAPPTSRLFADGGLVVLRQGPAMALLRYPRFHFRPAHDDIMHVDMWLNGRSILPDGGSYSYNAGEEWIRYFMGSESHNSISFDARGHMPKVSRFLFGAWPQGQIDVALDETDGGVRFACHYRDWHGVQHRRELRLSESRLTVIDQFTGVASKATLRWRLGGGQWTADADGMSRDTVRIGVQSSPPTAAERTLEGYESLHYGEKSSVQVWELDTSVPGCFETTVSW